MILMIHMIDTDNIVGHIFGANFRGYYIYIYIYMYIYDTFATHDMYDTSDT